MVGEALGEEEGDAFIIPVCTERGFKGDMLEDDPEGIWKSRNGRYIMDVLCILKHRAIAHPLLKHTRL